MRLTTERLELSPWTAAERPVMEALYTDIKAMRYVYKGKPLSQEAVDAALQLTLSHYLHGLGNLAMRLRDREQIIGECGLQFLEDTEEIEIGWLLMPAYWGQGYGTEAARAVLRFGFLSLGLEEVIAVADKLNHASLRIIDKLGMQFVGCAGHYGSILRKYSIDRSAYLRHDDTSQREIFIACRPEAPKDDF